MGCYLSDADVASCIRTLKLEVSDFSLLCLSSVNTLLLHSLELREFHSTQAVTLSELSILHGRGITVLTIHVGLELPMGALLGLLSRMKLLKQLAVITEGPHAIDPHLLSRQYVLSSVEILEWHGIGTQGISTFLALNNCRFPRLQSFRLVLDQPDTPLFVTNTLNFSIFLYYHQLKTLRLEVHSQVLQSVTWISIPAQHIVFPLCTPPQNLAPVLTTSPKRITVWSSLGNNQIWLFFDALLVQLTPISSQVGTRHAI